MRIVMTVPGLNLTSGVSVFCVETANALAAAGHDVTILNVGCPDYRPNANVRFVCEKTLDDLGFRPDVVHVHAVWVPFCVRAMRWCRRHGVPYVVSPHGSLMPRVFTTGWLKKRFFFALLARRGLARANVLHCTAAAEAEAVKRLGLKTPTAVIPLGTYVPPPKAVPTVSADAGASRRVILFVSRLGEEKGLVTLLDVWAGMDHRGWRLVLAGPDWQGYKAVLDRLVEARRIEDVEFPGVVRGEVKDAWYRRASLFVLPSPMENFSAVVLDALAYGVPAIATKGTPWRELETEHCGWWIDQGEEPLRKALEAGMSMTDDERRAIGANGRRLAASRYAWPRVADALEALYASACGHADGNPVRGVRGKGALT